MLHFGAKPVTGVLRQRAKTLIGAVAAPDSIHDDPGGGESRPAGVAPALIKESPTAA